jgi:hypothetical protein
MPFVFQFLNIWYTLNSIDPRDTDRSMTTVIGSIGRCWDFQQFVGFPLQILGVGMLVYWFLSRPKRACPLGLDNVVE